MVVPFERQKPTSRESISIYSCCRREICRKEKPNLRKTTKSKNTEERAKLGIGENVFHVRGGEEKKKKEKRGSEGRPPKHVIVIVLSPWHPGCGTIVHSLTESFCFGGKGSILRPSIILVGFIQPISASMSLPRATRRGRSILGQMAVHDW